MLTNYDRPIQGTKPQLGQDLLNRLVNKSIVVAFMVVIFILLNLIN